MNISPFLHLPHTTSRPDTASGSGVCLLLNLSLSACVPLPRWKSVWLVLRFPGLKSLWLCLRTLTLNVNGRPCAENILHWLLLMLHFSPICSAVLATCFPYEVQKHLRRDTVQLSLIWAAACSIFSLLAWIPGSFSGWHSHIMAIPDIF